ncbi:S24 family peptidase [Proteus myxofaciens]|nr:S24 family peptidase [Proteus myxofaciens]
METKDIRRMNLRSLISEYARKGINKAIFAERAGLNPAQLSQISGDNPSRNIGDLIARRIELSLELTNGWLDNIHQSEPSKVINNNYLLESISNKNTDCIYRIDQLEMEYSCGGGRLNNDYLNVVKAVELVPEHAKRLFGGRNANALRIVTAVGDSMSGTIDPGTLVIVDITTTKFISDGIYAFRFGEAMHIKRLQLLGDRLLVISDNKAYDKWEIDANNEDQFQINGFVVGKWDMHYTRLG